MTEEEVVHEFVKCGLDVAYYAQKYCQAFDQTQKGFVPLKVFPRQKELLHHFDLYRFSIVLKPRQAGVSTVTALFCAHKILFAPPSSPEKILIVANKKETAIEFLKKIKGYIETAPSWLGVTYLDGSNNASTFTLTNGSSAKAVGTSGDALRGYTPTVLVLDEAAFIEGADELWTSAAAALSTGGSAIFVSCVTKDTFVFTDKGIKQVGDFADLTKPNNPLIGYKIPEYNIQGYVKSRKSDIFVNDGIQDTLKIESTSAELEGTLRHKVWAFSRKDDKYGIYKFQDLKVGDMINIQSGFELWGADDDINFDYTFSNKETKPSKIYNKIDEDLAYLLGLYISEGSVYAPVYKGKARGCDVTITCGDSIADAITNAGFRFSAHDGLHHKISSKYLGALLTHLGFNISLKAPQKTIPERLLRMSRKNIVAMLQGIMDGDGYSDAKRGRIGINLSSEKLVKQLRALFINFGILTDYQTGICPPSERVKVSSEYFRISATDEHAKIYYDKIGFRFERKQRKQSGLLGERQILNPQDCIPNGKIIIREILNDNKLVKKLRGSGLKVNSLKTKSKTSDLNKVTFKSFIDYFETTLHLDLSKYEIDKKMIPNGKWERIQTITESENETFDFSLPDTDDFWCHSVNYNGILGFQTPNGQDPLYYKTYSESIKGRNDFKIFDMFWWQDPRFNKDLRFEKAVVVEEEVNGVLKRNVHREVVYADKLADGTWDFDHVRLLIKNKYEPLSGWFETMCLSYNGDERKIAQELKTVFTGSGDNVFKDEYIINHELNTCLPENTGFFDNNLWIWEEPQDGCQYLLGSDVSRGDADDFSSIEIWNMTTGEQAAEWVGKVPPDVLGVMIDEIGRKYNAYAVVDITGGLGSSTIIKLIELDYPHIHYSDKGGTNDALKNKLKSFTNTKDQIPGFLIGKNRSLAIAALESAIRNNEIVIKSKRLIDEFRTFIYINGRPDHKRGNHDDMIIALAMIIYTFQYSFKNVKAYDDQTKAMLNAYTKRDVENAVVIHTNDFIGNNGIGAEHNWLF